MSIISLRHVNKWFGQHHVLNDINLDVAEREVVVILGPSGSGKSTTIRCINRLESIQQGRNPLETYYLSAIVYFILNYILGRISVALQRRRQ